MAISLLSLTQTLYCLSICVPLISSFNTSSLLSLIPLEPIYCDYAKYAPTGCAPGSHRVCQNTTATCRCDPSGALPIPLADQCLAVRNIDQSCVVSTQCSKSAKNQLFCFHFEPNIKQLIELNESVALDLKRKLNQTVEGFCRCDNNHYYDYADNQCIHKSNAKDVQSFIDQFFCSQCPLIDENSQCDPKSGRCLCKEAYIKNANGKCAPKRFFYERCGALDECIDSNTYCDQTVGQCICEEGFYPDHNKKLCLKGRHILDKCAQHHECTYLFGYCDPNRNECSCDPKDSVRVNNNCIRKTFYGQNCHHKFPDLVCQLSLPYSICSRYTNRCVCDFGFIYLSNECKRVDINRLGISDDFRTIEDNKNPMTYIVIVFCTVFGFTIFASILIKMFRRPYPRPVPRRPIALYDVSERSTHSLHESRPPSAPPVYSESRLRNGSQTTGSHITVNDNEDKPPSYEEAISSSYCLDQNTSTQQTVT